jgi:hypothetical protein
MVAALELIVATWRQSSRRRGQQLRRGGVTWSDCYPGQQEPDRVPRGHRARLLGTLPSRLEDRPVRPLTACAGGNPTGPISVTTGTRAVARWYRAYWV